MEQSPRYTLRPANAREAPAVAALLRTAVPESVRPLTILGQDGVAAWIARAIRGAEHSSDGPEPTFLVAAAKGSICGAAEWRRYDKTLFLNSIAVDPSHQNRGVGTQLLQWGLRTFDGMSDVALDVFRDNRAVRTWYGRIGFQTTTSRRWLVGPLDAGIEVSVGNPANADASGIRLRNETDAAADHERFGFSTLRFEVQDPSGPPCHEVGRLGDDYFRITDAATARARPIRAALLTLDSSRSLLYLPPPSSSTPDVFFPPEQTTCRAESLRMSAPISVVDPALRDLRSSS